jgi:hypothetical protein
MEKIISFSIYGKNPKYGIGALENAKLSKIIYPEWKARFYIADDVSKDLVNKIMDLNCEVIIKPRMEGHLNMFDRFEPLKDLAIERFIVRDSDSRLSIKEAAAVKEWIESGKEFHIMRDHPQHGAYICGGLWGATSEFIKKIAPIYDLELEKFKSDLTFNQLYHPHRGKWFNCDQPFLWKFIWPKIINSHLAHIKDLSNLRFTGNEKLFPIENPDGSFIGQIVE